jgi:hypothetical protein
MTRERTSSRSRAAAPADADDLRVERIAAQLGKPSSSASPTTGSKSSGSPTPTLGSGHLPPEKPRADTTTKEEAAND